MKFELGAMSVGDILDRGLKLLLARLPTFYAINLIVMLPLLLFQLALPQLTSGQQGQASIGFLAVLLLFSLLLSLMLSPIGAASMLYIVAQQFINREVGLRSAFAFAFRSFFSLLFVSFLYGIFVVLALGLGILTGIIFVVWVGLVGMVLGLGLGMVTGVIFLVWFAFVGQVVVVEHVGVFESFKRSKDLTAGFRWRLFAVFLLFLAILIAVVLVLAIIQLILPGFEFVPIQGGGMEPVTRSYFYHVIHAITGFLLSTLAQTYSSICLTLFYFDLRIRKEGYDLELAAQQSGAL
jgi:hypothetical protein